MSIQIDETADVSTREQLCVIVRFERKGEVVERFLKFYNVSSDRTAPAICDVVKLILSKYGETLKSKLVMQTYDGASVMAGHISGVQQLLRQDFPYAYFFHCAAHRLNLVLCQSASSISLVKVFFANDGSFSSFSSAGSKRKDLFRRHGMEIPQPGDTRWYYRSRTISVLCDRYLPLIDALNSALNNPHISDDITVSASSGLLHHLNSFFSVFRLLFSTRFCSNHLFSIRFCKTEKQISVMELQKY